jgi:hypothetical protein
MLFYGSRELRGSISRLSYVVRLIANRADNISCPYPRFTVTMQEIAQPLELLLGLGEEKSSILDVKHILLSIYQAKSNHTCSSR